MVIVKVQWWWLMPQVQREHKMFLWNFCGDSPDGEESWVKVQREKKKKWSPKSKVEDEDG